MNEGRGREGGRKVGGKERDGRRETSGMGGGNKGSENFFIPPSSSESSSSLSPHCFSLFPFPSRFPSLSLSPVHVDLVVVQLMSEDLRRHVPALTKHIHSQAKFDHALPHHFSLTYTNKTKNMLSRAVKGRHAVKECPLSPPLSLCL
jgi:hypothetical protein